MRQYWDGLHGVSPSRLAQEFGVSPLTLCIMSQQPSYVAARDCPLSPEPKSDCQSHDPPAVLPQQSCGAEVATCQPTTKRNAACKKDEAQRTDR